MIGWHHRLSGHGFEQTPGDGEGQGVEKESDTTERLNSSRRVLSCRPAWLFLVPSGS